MRQIAVAALLCLAAPLAAHAGEGVYVTFDGGYALWNKDKFKTRLAGQVGNATGVGLSNADLLVDRQMPDGGIFGVRMGYNIGGHVAFEGILAIRPYDALEDTRGGLGMAGVGARWFPLQGLLRPNRQFDLSLNGGMGYVLSGGGGIHGTDANGKTIRVDNSGRGFDAIAVELGGTLELYPARWFSIGLSPRIMLMDPIRYIISYDARDAGGSIPLSGRGGLSLMSLSVSFSFHVEPQPD